MGNVTRAGGGPGTSSLFDMARGLSKEATKSKQDGQLKVAAKWEGQRTSDPALKVLWTPPAQVDDAALRSLHRSLALSAESGGGDFTVRHVRADGRLSFAAVLMVPDLPGQQDEDGFAGPGLRIFSRDGVELMPGRSLLPAYLDPVSGAVQFRTELPRARAAADKFLKALRKALVRECLWLFSDLEQKGGDVWENFLRGFSWNVKIGVCTDPANRARLQEMLRYRCAGGGGGGGHGGHGGNGGNGVGARWTSLSGYVSRMPESQCHIFFATGRDVQVGAVPRLIGLFFFGVFLCPNSTFFFRGRPCWRVSCRKGRRCC